MFSKFLIWKLSILVWISSMLLTCHQLCGSIDGAQAANISSRGITSINIYGFNELKVQEFCNSTVSCFLTDHYLNLVLRYNHISRPFGFAKIAVKIESDWKGDIIMVDESKVEICTHTLITSQQDWLIFLYSVNTKMKSMNTRYHIASDKMCYWQ